MASPRGCASGGHGRAPVRRHDRGARPPGLRAPVEAAVARVAAIATAARVADRRGRGHAGTDAWAAAEAGYAERARRRGRGDAGRRAGLFAGFSQFTFGASTQLVMFMFLTSMTARRRARRHQQLGVSRRMVSTPTSAGTIVARRGCWAGSASRSSRRPTSSRCRRSCSGSCGATRSRSARSILVFALVARRCGDARRGARDQRASRRARWACSSGWRSGALGGCMIPIQMMPDAMQRSRA